MRINTDGVLLGAWMHILPTDRSFLDIGSGCGVITALSVQRTMDNLINNRITSDYEFYKSGNYEFLALEPDKGSFEDAEENLNDLLMQLHNIPNTNTLNNDEEQKEIVKKFSINLLNIAIQDYWPTEDKKYNLIFSNPPYFINSLKPQENKRLMSRHTDTLSQTDLIMASIRLLKNGGRLAVILPAEEGEMFIKKVIDINKIGAGGKNMLYLSRICYVRTTERKPVKRYLMEFTVTNDISFFNGIVENKIERENLIIMENGTWSAAYKVLTNNFYINF